MGFNEIETPAFVIDLNELDDNIEEFRRALEERWPNYCIGYSVKTNSLPWLLQYVKEKGCLAEVVSSDEYNLAKCMGFKDSEMIFNGPVKDRRDFELCVKAGGLVNLDARRELDWLESLSAEGVNCRIGLRVNFDLEAEVPGQIGYEEDGTRFGFSYESGELKKAIDRIASMDGVDLVGLHMHSTSRTRSVDVYRALARKAAAIAAEYELTLRYVDIGGGFYGGLPTAPSYADYIDAIEAELSGQFDKDSVMLIVEPGASVIASPIKFVSSVVDVREMKKARHVIMDGGRSNIDPLHTKKSYFYELETKGSPYCGKQVISGFTCMEADRIMTLFDAPELSVGDRILFDKVGSYTMTLNPLFIKWFPDVYAMRDGKLLLVRGRWESKDLVSLEERVLARRRAECHE